MDGSKFVLVNWPCFMLPANCIGNALITVFGLSGLPLLLFQIWSISSLSTFFRVIPLLLKDSAIVFHVAVST